MTLHDTAEFSKKGGIAISIGLGVILLIIIFVKVGKFVNSIINPPRIDAPNEVYGKIPSITFPQSTVKGQFTYTINTVNGSLPSDFPDRLIIYPMVISEPNLLNLDEARTKIQALGFIDQVGNTLPEIPRGGPNYEWDEPNGFQLRIIYNIVNKSFSMTSNYLTSLVVLNAQNIGDQNAAV